jgi:hypothetical protein
MPLSKKSTPPAGGAEMAEEDRREIERLQMKEDIERLRVALRWVALSSTDELAQSRARAALRGMK